MRTTDIRPHERYESAKGCVYEVLGVDGADVHYRIVKSPWPGYVGKYGQVPVTELAGRLIRRASKGGL